MTRCLLTVHAHPDDESSKGAGSVAKYHDAGVHTVLVTCTGGEQGDILNPAMDKPGVLEDLVRIRRAELDRAAAIIGYDEVVLLGYRDSGMPGTEANNDPRSFAQADLDEAVGRLVTVIRRTRPQVVVTYPAEQTGYPHPDHIRTNVISELAFDAAADPDRYTWAGPVWQPLRMYYVAWSAQRMRLTHEKFLELGLKSPYDEKRMARMKRELEAEEKTETVPRVLVDIRSYMHVSRDALIAHATQVDPTSGHWFGLPPEVADSIYPYDEYILARDLTGDAAAPGEEGDLFAGIAADLAGAER